MAETKGRIAKMRFGLMFACEITKAYRTTCCLCSWEKISDTYEQASLVRARHQSLCDEVRRG